MQNLILRGTLQQTLMFGFRTRKYLLECLTCLLLNFLIFSNLFIESFEATESIQGFIFNIKILFLCCSQILCELGKFVV